MLDNFRQKAILPTYLSPEQRKKMYKAKLKNILEHDPITMEIDGVVHKFRHVNKTTDLPSTNKTLKKALELMKTPADFQNVPAFLEGCLRARRDIPRELRNKIIRQAAMHNSQHVIIECAKAVDRTGFKLNSSENINELLVSLQLPAIESGWAEGKTKAALKQVRLIINMLEDERHFPGRQTKCQFPFYRDPQVLASGLHMAAARAVHHLDGKDADGKVTRFAEELVALWPEDAGLLDLQPAEFYQNADKTKYLLDRNHFLWYASPVLNGLNLAAQVVSGSNAGLAQQLQRRASRGTSRTRRAGGSRASWRTRRAACCTRTSAPAAS